MARSKRKQNRGKRNPAPSPTEIRSGSMSVESLFAGTLSPPTLAGTAISDQSALSITSVWNAVNIYANTIASLDLYVAERTPDGGRRAAYEHPVYDLVHLRPNRITTSFRLRQSVMAHALTTGNSYLEIERKGGVPVGLHLLESRKTRPVFDDAGNLWYTLDSSGKRLAAADVVHIAGLGWDGIKGYSPITLARESLGLAMAEGAYQSALLGNGAVPQGHLEFPGSIKEDAKGRMRDSWNKTHQGPTNAGTMAILEGGVKWVQESFSPADAQLLLSRNFSVAEVARLFNLPQHMLGNLDKATFGNIEEQNIQFYQLSLMPWLESIEQELNVKLFSQVDRTRFFIKHDIDSIMRANTSARMDRVTRLFGVGSLSINEIRAGEGLNPLEGPGGNKHWIPVNNLMSVEDMDKVQPEPVAVIDPDDTTNVDVVVTPDTSGPEPLPAEALNSIREVAVDAIGRMIRRESQAARRASKRDGFDGWVGEYYASHHKTTSEAIGPAVRALGAVTGLTLDPLVIASRLAVESRDRLRGLVVCFPPTSCPRPLTGSPSNGKPTGPRAWSTPSWPRGQTHEHSISAPPR